MGNWPTDYKMCSNHPASPEIPALTTLTNKSWSNVGHNLVNRPTFDYTLFGEHLTKVLVISWSKVSQKLVNWLKCWSNLSRLTFDQHEDSWPSCRLVTHCECGGLSQLGWVIATYSICLIKMMNHHWKILNVIAGIHVASENRDAGLKREKYDCVIHQMSLWNIFMSYILVITAC